MSKSFQITLITPEEAVLETEATYANLPAHDGQMGILQNRAPMLVQLGSGTLELDTVGGKRRFALEGGFAQMQANRLTLLSEKAEEIGAASKAGD